MEEKEKNNEKLLTDFPPVSTEAWEEVIHTDLKGGDYDKRLIWKPLEGFKIKPYYRAEDLAKLPNVDTQPGKYPYIRGNYPNKNQWLIRQDIPVKNYEEANATARDAIEKGCTSIGFIFGTHDDHNQKDLLTLLKDIDPKAIELNFINPGRGDFLLPSLTGVFAALGPSWSAVHGSVGFSQLTWLTLRGKLCKNHGGPVIRALKSLAFRRQHPGLQVLAVDGRVFHNAGATAVQELAFTLSQAAQYLDLLTDQGLKAEEIASSIRFNFSVGPQYFIEMAKFRAARYLWTRLLKAYGVTDPQATKMIAHAETSRFNQTVYDPYVNLLRAATESMSAIIAGVHSLTVMPFDTPYAEPSPFSNRLARNAQLLLRDESYFDKVVDPAGGSYYIETLTHELIQSAWELFLEVQAEGGFIEAFDNGTIQSRVEAIAQKRRERFATRRDTLLGTNQFPNFNEVADPEILSHFLVPIQEADCGCHHDDTVPNAPLEPFRGAEQFERVRFITDKAERRPVAFMLTLGNLAMRRARAQFSCNFLACAGFQVIDNIGFNSVEEGLEAAREAKSDIIVLCSSDDEYLELGKEVFPKIKENEIFIIAGAPACKAELEALGVKHFIHVKSNLLETLKLFQRELGIIE